MRTPESDPLPPKRTYSQFYSTTVSVEYLKGDNDVREAVLDDPSSFNLDDFNDETPLTLKARWQARHSHDPCEASCGRRSSSPQ